MTTNLFLFNFIDNTAVGNVNSQIFDFFLVFKILNLLGEVVGLFPTPTIATKEVENSISETLAPESVSTDSLVCHVNKKSI